LQIGRLQVASKKDCLYQGFDRYPHLATSNMQPSSKFRDWASMARLPNIPTVWSNVFTGWIFGLGSFYSEANWFVWAFLMATMLYVGGTILNDWHDANYDRQHRPERPIPSGRVSRPWAGIVAALLLGLGAGLSFMLGMYGISENCLFFLLPLILLYTYVHKPFPLIGGIVMGLCRVALGFLVGPHIISSPPGISFEVISVLWLLALFFYVCTISWIAIGESVAWRRKTVVWMLTALPLLDAAFLTFAGEARLIFVPIICFGLAWYLRRVASPT
jgi:4-hydroxybenzoate polyprenyltransferase